jgi:hypothetical protein
MQTSDLLFFLPFVLAFLLIWAHVRRRTGKQRRLNQVWREFAALKGLQEQSTKDDAFISFRGENQNMPFVLECIATQGTPFQIGKLKMRRGDAIKIFSRMKIELSGLPKGLRVYRETTWSKLGKALGMQDITTGDSRFDSSFMIKGKDPAEVLTYLTLGRRMALLMQVDELRGLELQEEGLILVQPNQIDSMERLDRYFSQLGSLASALLRS